MEQVIIREATSEDIPVIVDFQMEMALESEGLTLDAQVLLTGVTAVFNDPTRGFYRIAEHDGKIVGCHLVTPEWSDWRNHTIWWIQSLYVIPAYRKTGVFKKMYLSLQELVNLDPGLAGIRLYVYRGNENAMRAYEKLGMDGEHYRFFEWMKP